MSITITDPALLAQLTGVTGHTVIRDAAGRVVGTFEGLPPVRVASGREVPFTDEELAERSKQRTGRPLADILKDLQAKYGE